MASKGTDETASDGGTPVVDNAHSELEERRALQGAVKKLIEVVTVLQETIQGEYISRREVTEHFTSKQQSVKARRLFVMLLLAAMLGGFVTTVSTVSFCFLTPRGDQAVCHILPGYAAAQERNKSLMGLFNDVITTTDDNRARIEKLEEKAR